MTKKELMESLKDYPDNAEIVVEVAADDTIYTAFPTAIWVRHAATNLQLIISNDD